MAISNPISPLPYTAELSARLNAVERQTEEAFSDLLHLFSFQTIKKGAYFAREGERPQKLCFLGKGFFRAYYLSSNGTEYNKSFYLENDFYCAYSSLILNQPNYINIQAMEDCEMLVCNYHEMTRLYDKHHCLERFSRKVAEWLFAKKEMREIQMVIHQAEERYQIFLQEYPNLENRIPQYHIASYLGITPVQLSRIRAKKK